jgi:hypothetical protein
MTPALLGILTLLLTGAPGEVDDTASLLEEVDRILAPTRARREPQRASPLCDSAGRRGEPGAENRDFLCSGTSSIGTWKLERLRADGGSRVSAELELRRFTSPQAAEEAKRTALERHGGESPTFINEGAISWCYLDVYWTETLLLALRYGCHISLRHVKALAKVKELLRAQAKPFGEARVAGVIGTHSGWSFLVDPEDRRIQVPDGPRFHRFMRVDGVRDNDVLWIREQAGSEYPKVDKLAPTARCIPVVFTPPYKSSWIRLKGPKGEGWAHRRFLRDEAPEDCRGRE